MRVRNVASVATVIALASSGAAGCSGSNAPRSGARADEGTSTVVADDCNWKGAPGNLTPMAPLVPTTDPPGGSTTTALDTPIESSTGGPITIYFLAANRGDAEERAKEWGSIDLKSPDVIDNGPAPWDLDTFLVILDSMTPAAVNALTAPVVSTCGDVVLEEIRPEIVTALAKVESARVDDLGDEWERYGVHWFADGGDNADGITRLSALATRAAAAHKAIYCVLSP